MSECCIWSAPQRNGFVHFGFSEPIRQEFSTDCDSPTEQGICMAPVRNAVSPCS